MHALAALIVFAASDVGDLDKPARDFVLKDVASGKDVRLSDHAGKTVVLCFVGVNCGMVDRHLERLALLASDYAAKGVVLIGIDSNANESAEDAAKFVKDKKVPYPVLHDPDRKAAGWFRATHTPQLIVIDAKGVWRYSGAFDDNPFPERVTKNYVRDALDAVLAGKAPPVKKTDAYGCRIAKAK